MLATLHVIFGPGGAGKTTYAHEFARRNGAVAFVLDEWMGRLFAPDMPKQIEYAWMVDRVGRCEEQIWSTAAATLFAGVPVVLDIGLMTRADRARVRQIAESADLPLQFHFVTAPQEIRRARIEGRAEVQGEGFSLEVSPHMFEFIEGVYEAPEPDELVGAIISESN